MRLRSDIHKLLPTFHHNTWVLIPWKKKLKRLCWITTNSKLYFASTLYWNHSPLLSLGIDTM